MKKLILSALFLLLIVSPALAMDVELVWDAPPGTVTGYKVCMTNVSGVYDRATQCQDVGDVLTWAGTVPDVFPVHWVVFAYNPDGESGFSNEVGFPTGPPDPTPAPENPPNFAGGPGGAKYTRPDGAVFIGDPVTGTWTRQ